MPLTTIGAEFERIRMAQGEAAALAFLKAGQPSAAPFVNPAFGVTGTLQQVFNFASRINRDRLIAQQRIEASIAETRMEVRRGFSAVAAALGRR
jgi:hypothetical protein